MTTSKKIFTLAQFSDCHLFSDKEARHLGANVWKNLNRVLTDIAKRTTIDCVVFTGDLTQDHSEQSYQHFVSAIQKAKIPTAVHFVLGNHDDRVLVTKHLSSPSFDDSKTIDSDFWQIQLLDSKSDTPSGLVSTQHIHLLSQQMNQKKSQLLMMHHHPIDVGYFIDEHGLQSKDSFWQALKAHGNIKGIACGHVHRAVHLSECNVDVYTCPATSVQFGDTKEDIGSIEPSYRLFHLASDGSISSEIIAL